MNEGKEGNKKVFYTVQVKADSNSNQGTDEAPLLTMDFPNYPVDVDVKRFRFPTNNDFAQIQVLQVEKTL